MTRITQKELQAKFDAGESQRSIARSLNVSYQTIQEYRRRWGMPLLRKARIPATGYARFIDGRYGYAFVPNPRGRQGGKIVAEHVLFAEERLGRRLRRNEVTHHLNGIKDDNRLENLVVVSRSRHLQLHRQLEAIGMEMVLAGEIVYEGGEYKRI